MKQEWFSAKESPPDEDETVLVYLESHYVALGIFLNGRWEICIPPWESSFWNDSRVLYWIPVPLPLGLEEESTARQDSGTPATGKSL